MPTILPTGTCFDDAAEILLSLLKENPELKEFGSLFIVHAICRAPKQDGSTLDWAHGWVEDYRDGSVLWFGMLNGEKVCLGTDKADFYDHHQPRTLIRYSPLEFITKAKQVDGCGPFDPDIIAHCAKPGEGGKPIGVMDCKPIGETVL